MKIQPLSMITLCIQVWYLFLKPGGIQKASRSCNKNTKDWCWHCSHCRTDILFGTVSPVTLGKRVTSRAACSMSPTKFDQQSAGKRFEKSSFERGDVVGAALIGDEIMVSNSKGHVLEIFWK